MNATASAAVSVLTRPFARIPEVQRRRIWTGVADRGGGRVPAGPQQRCRHRQHGQRGGLRHAGTGAEHRRWLRRPAGSRLCRVLRHRRLYLRHSHRIPAAAGVECVLGAVPFPWPGREDAGRHRRWQRGALHAVVLACAAARGVLAAFFGVLFGAPTLATEGRLPGHRHLGLRRDRADRGAQLVGSDQWRRRPERRRGATAVRLELRRGRDAVLLCRDRAGGAADLCQCSIA